MNIMNVITPFSIRQALAGDEKKGRALFAAAREPERWQEIINSPRYRPFFLALAAEGKEWLARPVEVLSYSSFKRFWETGSRREYETLFFARRRRLAGLALLALAYGDPRYLTALEDVIWAIGEEFTWCLPAHLKDWSEEGGKHGRRPEEIDLFAAETAFTLAEIVSLVPGLAGPVVARAREEVFRRVIIPFADPSRFWWWEEAPMNWAAVCGGGVGAAALYLIEEEGFLARVLCRVLGALQAYLEGFGDDGASPEGVAYWAYGFGYFTYFAALLAERTGGRLDLFRPAKIAAIASFPGACYLSGDQVVSFSDTPRHFTLPPGLMAYLQTKFNGLTFPAGTMALGGGDRLSWPVAVRDLVWGWPRTVEEPPEGTYYFPDVQWFIARKKSGPEMVVLAAKGGHNGEPHNHNDLGSFILHINGDTLLGDPGRQEYTREYFGPERYHHFCTASYGHSVPIIDGKGQEEGPAHAAEVIAAEEGSGENVFVLELAGAYGGGNLRSLRRSFIFKKDALVFLKLVDEFRFTVTPHEVVERFIAFVPPRVVAPGRILLAGEKGRAVLVYPAEMMRPKIEKTIFFSPDHGETTVYLLDLVAEDFSPHFSVEISFRGGREE